MSAQLFSLCHQTYDAMTATLAKASGMAVLYPNGAGKRPIAFKRIGKRPSGISIISR